MLKLSATQLRWFRWRRSGLVEPFATPEAAASVLAGIQAQILPAAGVSLWNRTTGLAYSTFDDLLHRQRSLVKLWGQRHTLHLYPSQEWPLIHGALAGQSTWWERQAAKNGADLAARRATIARLAQLLRQHGVLSRSDLRAAGLPLDEEHFSSWGGIFADMVRAGHACHAGQNGNEGRFAHREHWLPGLPWNPPPLDEANIELTRRYLAAYGPATAQDVAYWRGTSVGNVRRWLAALGEELIEVESEGQTRLALWADVDVLNQLPPAPEGWPMRLLYRFDPLLLGLKDKSWLVESEHYNRVWRPAGHIEGTVLENGRIAGVWRYDRRGGGMVVSVWPFKPLPAHAQAALESHAAGVAAFFETTLVDFVTHKLV